MADNTRLKDLSSELKRISDMMERSNQVTADRLGRLESSMSRVDHLETSLDAVTRAMDALTRSMDRLQDPSTSTSTNSKNSASSSSHSSQPFQMRQVKLDFPRFDGTDPLNWIFRAEQFFSYYDTPDPQRLTIAAVHMEGTVIPWFQMLQKSQQVSSWTALTEAIEHQ